MREPPILAEYGYREPELSPDIVYDIWETVNSLSGYFRRFAGFEVEEVKASAVLFAIHNYNPERSCISDYIKALARYGGCYRGREIPLDFLDQCVSADGGLYDDTTVSMDGLDQLTSSDFTGSVLDKVMLESDNEEIIELALSDATSFVQLCKSLSARDTRTMYFPDCFIDSCLRLSHMFSDFNSRCLSVYEKYKNELLTFTSYEEGTSATWKEADFGSIDKRVSKRVFLVNESGVPCSDPDKEVWYCSGSLRNKRVVRINYKDVLDRMCDLIDEDGTNPMKLTLGYRYIIRTLGGSTSVIDPVLHNEYELCRQEIITNLVYDLSPQVKILSCGSECLYLLVSPERDTVPDRVIRGVSLKFEVEDITDICEMSVRDQVTNQIAV